MQGAEKSLSRVRPPHVDMHYEHDHEGAIVRHQLPLTILLYGAKATVQAAYHQLDTFDALRLIPSFCHQTQTSNDIGVCDQVNRLEHTLSQAVPHDEAQLVIMFSAQPLSPNLRIQLLTLAKKHNIVVLFIADTDINRSLNAVTRLLSGFELYHWFVEDFHSTSLVSVVFDHSACKSPRAYLNALLIKVYLQHQYAHRCAGYLDVADAVAYLSQWLSQYVLIDEDASPVIQAHYPLHQAHISPIAFDKLSGRFACELLLSLNYSFETPVSVRMSTLLSQ